MAERMVPLVGRARGQGAVDEHVPQLRRCASCSRSARRSSSASRFVIFDQGDSLGVVKDILRELRRSGAARKLDPSGDPGAHLELEERAARARRGARVGLRVRRRRARGLPGVRGAAARDVRARLRRPRASCRCGCSRASPEARKRWQRRFDHVLVDEFQDTSKVQLELVKLLANARGNVCVVGDDDQSIYGWRGAEVGNILDFERHFPGATHRQARGQLPLARGDPGGGQRRDRAEHAAAPRQDAARGARAAATRCGCACATTPADEAKLVAREIRDVLQGRHARAATMAVLYRSNLQARADRGGAARSRASRTGCSAARKFFDRREVKDVAAYLRVMLNPSDEVSLRRIINQPPRGIGAKTVERIEQHAAADRHELLRARCATRRRSPGCPTARSARSQAFAALLDAARPAAASAARASPRSRARWSTSAGIKTRPDGRRRGRPGRHDPLGQRRAPVRLARAARAREGRGQARAAQLPRARHARASSSDDEEPGDAVTLSTLHGARGSSSTWCS